MYRRNKPDHQWVTVEAGGGYMGVYLHYTLLLWGIFEIFYTKRFLLFLLMSINTCLSEV